MTVQQEKMDRDQSAMWAKRRENGDNFKREHREMGSQRAEAKKTQDGLSGSPPPSGQRGGTQFTVLAKKDVTCKEGLACPDLRH